MKTTPYPGRTASSYLNPEIVPDLKDALALAHFILFRNRDEHPYLRTQIIGQLYAMMKILFDVLAGMLPCDEVVRLREAYDQFHNSDGRFGTFDEFLDRLRAVSRRFAAEEPKWERERDQSPYTKVHEAFRFTLSTFNLSTSILQLQTTARLLRLPPFTPTHS